MTDQEFAVANARRIELAEKKARGELTADEQVEFDRLQRECFACLGGPVPTDTGRLKEIEERLGEPRE